MPPVKLTGGPTNSLRQVASIIETTHKKKTLGFEGWYPKGTPRSGKNLSNFFVSRASLSTLRLREL